MVLCDLRLQGFIAFPIMRFGRYQQSGIVRTYRVPVGRNIPGTTGRNQIHPQVGCRPCRVSSVSTFTAHRLFLSDMHQDSREDRIASIGRSPSVAGGHHEWPHRQDIRNGNYGMRWDEGRANEYRPHTCQALSLVKRQSPLAVQTHIREDQGSISLGFSSLVLH